MDVGGEELSPVAMKTEVGVHLPSLRSPEEVSVFGSVPKAADLVLFFTGRDAIDAVMSKTGLTLGGDISVAAGPVGRRADAKTDFSQTGIFSYAATKGVFAGISLEGSVMAPDREANRTMYGKSMSTDDLF